MVKAQGGFFEIDIAENQIERDRTGDEEATGRIECPSLEASCPRDRGQGPWQGMGKREERVGGDGPRAGPT